jgi:hypothetical protein
VEQLDKFELVNKNIIGLNTSSTTMPVQIAIKDQGKEFKNTKTIIKYIVNNEE